MQGIGSVGAYRWYFCHFLSVGIHDAGRVGACDTGRAQLEVQEIRSGIGEDGQPGSLFGTAGYGGGVVQLAAGNEAAEGIHFHDPGRDVGVGIDV